MFSNYTENGNEILLESRSAISSQQKENRLPNQRGKIVIKL